MMCSVFGISGDEEAAYLTYLGLHSLQHRGQEGAGIVSCDGNDHHVIRRRGMVADIFQNGNLESLHGNTAIGHTRYSTTGSDTQANIQPLLAKCLNGWVSISHNGNLTNAAVLTADLERQGAIFQTTTDTEVIMHLMARCRSMDLPDALQCALDQVEGAYSLLVLDNNYMIAMRDPHGFRPLIYGDYRGKPVFSSESCAFDLIGAIPIREVKPGEMIIVNIETSKVECRQIFKPLKQNRCVFEMIYFSRPDSKVFQRSVYETRKALGRRLAQEQPALADLVVPVPDSV